MTAQDDSKSFSKRCCCGRWVNCNVYEGRVDELLEYASKKKDSFKDTHLFKVLEKVLKWIVPLHLVDPEAKNFRPDRCETFHDITRFAHEKAMAEMFLIGKGQDSKGGTIALGKEGPLDAHFIDMDGGVREGTKTASPEDILSIPFAPSSRVCSAYPGLNRELPM